MKKINWQPTIGIEVHAQLNTKTKLFCNCPNKFGSKENQNTCPICLAYPGVLPSPNKKAVEKAVKLGLAVRGKVNEISYFERKNYFYPDNPKAYQISQLQKPICTGGEISININEKGKGYTKSIPLNRIQIEEDAGKLVHSEDENIPESYVDLNRAGTPLLEIVSEAKINSSKEAVEYVRTLRNLMLYLDITDGNMQEGSLRADINVSLSPAGSNELGTRTETKNLNSFKSMEQAIEYEIKRQTNLLNQGEKITQETLLFDKKKLVTKPMRSKEEAQDYRYFLDPDIMPIKLEPSWIKEIQENLVELPQEKFTRFLKDYKLSEYDTWVLVNDKYLAEYFEKAVAVYPPAAKKICNWVTTEVLSILNFKQISINDFPLESKHLGTLVKLIDEGVISGKIAKTIFPDMVEKNLPPEKIMQEKNIQLVSDDGEIEKIIQEIIDKNPEAVQKYQEGSQKVMGFFVGQIMQATKGQANPQKVNALLKKLLSS